MLNMYLFTENQLINLHEISSVNHYENSICFEWLNGKKLTLVVGDAKLAFGKIVAALAPTPRDVIVCIPRKDNERDYEEEF